MYSKGEGVPQDDVEAVKWWREAAEQGFAEAQFRLGVMYHLGEGVPQDYVEAAKWWRKTAEQGDADAQFWVGVMCAKGEGVPKDVVEAYAWFLLAKANGENLERPNGKEEVSELIFSLEKMLTAEQMEKGQARAAELRRLYGKQSER